ncbi:alpha/beta fold hydrolase [bacterium]|nr:alpha/beta fold hydrolase [bacterium]
MSSHSSRHSAGGIDWYIERAGSGPALILVPSGEGDCSAFHDLIEHLAGQFSILTFDTPGFSRSSTPSGEHAMTIPALAGHIAALVRSLGIGPATFYGCSSGGRAVLDLVSDHPELVRNAIVHEVALPSPWVEATLDPMQEMADEQIVRTCAHAFANVMNEDPAPWHALGDAYHRRLTRNYVTWARNYLGAGMGGPVDPQRLNNRPVAWTIGGLTPPDRGTSNLELARQAGIAIQKLPCRHFPHVSIPDRLAAHIIATTLPHLE